MKKIVIRTIIYGTDANAILAAKLKVEIRLVLNRSIYRQEWQNVKRMLIYRYWLKKKLPHLSIRYAEGVIIADKSLSKRTINYCGPMFGIQLCSSFP
jgi:GrpB-like predicted nucleotidyltransferase (UPF0157 family)